MDWIAAVIAGLAATTAISVVMTLAPRMGIPPIAIWDLLGSMFDPAGNRTLGWVAHFMMGVIFALIYAFLWSTGISSASVHSGVVFGAIHWLLVGLVMGMMPVLHAGMRAGGTATPGFYMLRAGGIMALMGGLVGHLI